LIQVCLRNPTGTGASPSRKDRDVFGYNLFEHFAQRCALDFAGDDNSTIVVIRFTRPRAEDAHLG
jgi:hypothetical protein